VIATANGDRYVGYVVLASIVVPVAVVAGLGWFFWRHRHDD
jgi:hypothetical protein